MLRRARRRAVPDSGRATFMMSAGQTIRAGLRRQPIGHRACPGSGFRSSGEPCVGAQYRDGAWARQ
eukprot:11200504-Lingulodinium_polyedra.AAC.1